mmetsp:Transcript_14452/g.16525  ORF Transcript_14452/g.16525 Transcript_14452/m.16525 type:complete len:304 (+) Transcript_14452:370-1281(+)
MPIECDYNCKVPYCRNLRKHQNRQVCSRCKCDCDGNNIEVKLSRKRGKRKQQKPLGSRTAKKKARNLITEQNTEDASWLEDKVIRSLQRLVEAFGFSESTVRNLPSEYSRENDEEIKKNKPKLYSTMTQALLKVLNTSANILYPAAPAELLDDIGAKLVPERRNKTHEKIGKSFSNIIALLYEKLPKASIEKRVVRAVLVKCLTNKEIEELKRRGRLTLWGKAKQMGYNDFKTLNLGNLLQNANIKRQFIDEDVVEAMVRHILSEDNIGILSWGGKNVWLDHAESVELPNFIRRKSLGMGKVI